MCFGDWSREDFVMNEELVEFLEDGPPLDNNNDFVDDDDDSI